jgi:hypothetical protein
LKTQIHISDASGAEDRVRVDQILTSAAAKFGIVDTTVTSRVPDTIRCYSERVGFGFAIGGRVVGELIVVDFYSGKAASSVFPVIEEDIILELRRTFGERMHLPNESEHIPALSTLPESDAAREFHRKHFRHGIHAA